MQSCLAAQLDSMLCVIIDSIACGDALPQSQLMHSLHIWQSTSAFIMSVNADVIIRMTFACADCVIKHANAGLGQLGEKTPPDQVIVFGKGDVKGKSHWLFPMFLAHSSCLMLSVQSGLFAVQSIALDLATEALHSFCHWPLTITLAFWLASCDVTQDRAVWAECQLTSFGTDICD